MQEWKWMEVWKWIQEWNEYRLDGNEGTNQCIIECTTQNVWMKNLCRNTCSLELPKESKW